MLGREGDRRLGAVLEAKRGRLALREGLHADETEQDHAVAEVHEQEDGGDAEGRLEAEGGAELRAVLGVIAQAHEHAREEDHDEQQRLERVQAAADGVAVRIEVVRILAEGEGEAGGGEEARVGPVGEEEHVAREEEATQLLHRLKVPEALLVLGP